MLFLLLIGVSGCEYQRVVKKGSTEEKQAFADKLYEKEQFAKALPLYEELLGTYRRRREGELIYFRFAMCHYQMSEFGIAAFHFKSFTETFATSSMVEDAAYWYAICQFNKTMPYYLDQTQTELAIEQLQLFINRYPSSKHVESCNEKMDILRRSLQYKAYKNAMAYYYRGLYNAAVVSLKNALISYPDIEERPEMEYLIVECSYLYAKRSVINKQEERYNNAIAECNEYLNTHEANDANRSKIEEIKEKAVQELAEVLETIKQQEEEKKLKTPEQEETETTRQ